MRVLGRWLMGFALGGGAAAVIVALFVPGTAQQVRARLRSGYQQALDEARRASAQRRAELEAELKQRQGQRPA